MAHIQKKGCAYPIRIKDIASSAGAAQGLDLPESEGFDLFVALSFTTKQTDDIRETVVTDLDVHEFSPPELQKLCNMRRGIETSFRELNDTVGLLHFYKEVGISKMFLPASRKERIQDSFLPWMRSLFSIFFPGSLPLSS